MTRGPGRAGYPDHNGHAAIYPGAPYQAADSAMRDVFTTR
jgi:hypothetical protein